MNQWRIQDFPLGGGGGGVRRPPMRTLFGENGCENERNGSCWRGGGGGAPWIRQCEWQRFQNQSVFRSENILNNSS